MPAPLQSFANAHTEGDFAVFRNTHPCSINTWASCARMDYTYDDQPQPSKVKRLFAPEAIGEPFDQATVVTAGSRSPRDIGESHHLTHVLTVSMAGVCRPGKQTSRALQDDTASQPETRALPGLQAYPK